MPDPVSGPAPAPVTAAIALAARRTGADFGTMLRQAQVESGLDPAARAGSSSAAGLFQFTRATWRTMLARHGAEHGLPAADADQLRFDPVAASLMAGELLEENRAGLEASLGRPAGEVDLYLAHFLGLDGAKRFLGGLAQTPDASAATLLPAAAAANPAIFYAGGQPRSLADVHRLLADKLARAGGTAPATPPPVVAPLVRLPAAAREDEPRPPLTLASIEPMPGRLSLALAVRASRQLAGSDR